MKKATTIAIARRPCPGIEPFEPPAQFRLRIEARIEAKLAHGDLKFFVRALQIGSDCRDVGV
jgi:hypothetical protein